MKGEKLTMGDPDVERCQEVTGTPAGSSNSTV